jgi:hypothetical protein
MPEDTFDPGAEDHLDRIRRTALSRCPEFTEADLLAAFNSSTETSISQSADTAPEGGFPHSGGNGNGDQRPEDTSTELLSDPDDDTGMVKVPEGLFSVILDGLEELSARFDRLEQAVGIGSAIN